MQMLYSIQQYYVIVGASGRVLPPVTGRSGFESRSPRIAQARVRLATDTLPQTPHRARALCTGYTHLDVIC